MKVYYIQSTESGLFALETRDRTSPTWVHLGHATRYIDLGRARKEEAIIIEHTNILHYELTSLGVVAPEPEHTCFSSDSHPAGKGMNVFGVWICPDCTTANPCLIDGYIEGDDYDRTTETCKGPSCGLTVKTYVNRTGRLTPKMLAAVEGVRADLCSRFKPSSVCQACTAFNNVLLLGVVRND